MANPYAGVEPTPRVRLAALLHESGIAKTKKEASEMAGLHPNTYTVASNGSEPVRRMADALRDRILDRNVDSADILSTLGREAIAKIYDKMSSDNENVSLKAAIDLADRSPEVSKVQKHEVSAGITIGNADAKMLADAMLESARLRSQYADVARDGLVEIVIDQHQLESGNG